MSTTDLPLDHSGDTLQRVSRNVEPPDTGTISACVGHEYCGMPSVTRATSTNRAASPTYATSRRLAAMTAGTVLSALFT